MSIEVTDLAEKKRVWPFNVIAVLALVFALSLMGSDFQSLLLTGASLLVAMLACACSLQTRRGIAEWLIAAVTLYFVVFFVRFLVA
jgi:hypothetical protein